MEFQAPSMESAFVDASLELPVEDSFVALDSSMDAAMEAAKDAADAVDDLVQHLSSAGAIDPAPAFEEAIVVETVINQSNAAEPVIEEIVQRVHQSLEVPFMLIASTLVLGIVIFIVIFLRRRRSRSVIPPPKATEAPAVETLENLVEYKESGPAAAEAEVEDEAASALAATTEVVDAPVTTEVVDAPVAIEESSSSSSSSSSEVDAVETEAEIQCVSAAEPEIQILACPAVATALASEIETAPSTEL